MTYSRVAWIVLVPALAIAAPKHKKATKTDKPADAAAGSGSSDKPADAADTTKDATKPDDKATTKSLLSTGTVGGGSGAASGGGAGSGSAAPSGDETPPPAANEPDVDSLRQEYLSLRDELFKSRARANAVASQLYSTRVTIKFTWTSARYYGVSKASVRLDGATVFEDAGGTIGGDDGVRFDGYIAPGRHLVTFHVEATGKDDDSFTSATESQVVVKAVANKDLVVAAKGHDSGDIAYEWKRKERGSYGIGIDVAVKTVAPAAADTAGATKGVKK